MTEIKNLSDARKKHRNIRGYLILTSTYISDVDSKPSVSRQLNELRINPGRMMDFLDEILESIPRSHSRALEILYGLQGKIYDDPQEAFVKAGLIQKNEDFERFRDTPLAGFHLALEMRLGVTKEIVIDDSEYNFNVGNVHIGNDLSVLYLPVRDKTRS